MDSQEMVRAPVSRHPRLVDGVIVGALLTFGVLPAALGALDSSFTAGDGTALSSAVLAVITLLQVLPLWWRRTRPELSFVVVTLAHLAQLLVTDEPMPSNVSALFSAYAIAAYSSSRRWRLLGLAVALLSGPIGAIDWYVGTLSVVPQVINAVAFSAIAALCWAWGDLTRRRRVLLERLQAQNDALRRDRDQRAALAAQDERTRIAREMHDVVAHSLAVVVVQADGAQYAAANSPTWQREHAVDALATIGETAREALADTRRLVGVLRSRDANDAEDYSPTESLDDLGAIVDRVRASGVSVRMNDLDGTALADVPRGTGLAALRVVQESLTNATKHAGPSATATVRLVQDEDALTVTVEDDGRGDATPDDGEGHGLVGMRERASSLGGTLTAGPRAGGGYRVVAHLPFADERG